MLRTIQELSCLILAFFIPETYYSMAPEVKMFFHYLKDLEKDRGIRFVIAYVKSSRLAVTRFLTGHPLSSLEGVGLKNGWPIWLSAFLPHIYDRNALRLLMTLLVSLRGIMLPPVLEVSPIVEAWKGKDSITESELSHACRQLRISRREVEWKQFHMSTKKGPIGQAILTSVTELTHLPLQLLADIKLIGGERLSSVIDALLLERWGSLSLASIWATIFPPKSGSFRKISYFSDKEGKTRVIAILDYWTQTALRPLHDALMDILRGIRSDCTFNQNHFLSVLPSVGPYYSLDLSNATDRMPIVVQLRVLNRVVGPFKALAWARLLTSYEFTTKGHPFPIKYGAGQPMGAYSSWGAMALTHHVLVHVAALRAGKPHFWAYTILGDDVVIADSKVATAYKALLLELDMPISDAKTHVSLDTYEFAKRWIHRGSEITGFAIAGIASVWNRYSLLHNFLDTQSLHGWSLDADRHPGLISALYKFYGRAEQSARVIKLYKVFDVLAKAGHTRDYEPVLRTVLEVFGVSSPFLGHGIHDRAKIAKAIMVEGKKRLVERDLEKFQKDAYSVSAKLTGTFLSKFPDLSVQDYRAALRGNHPLVTVLNSMIIESITVLREKFGRSVAITTARSNQFQAMAGTIDEVSEETYLEKVGLSKYFVSKGVFSMRASHSINLAQSQVTKVYITVTREWASGDLVIPTTSVAGALVSTGSAPFSLVKYGVYT
nr:MAG: putative RNA-dependent RNA polymerase [Mitoviridae sp.]